MVVPHGLLKEPITGPLKFKMTEIRHLENYEIHISTKYHPIWWTLVHKMHIWNSMTTSWPNMNIF